MNQYFTVTIERTETFMINVDGVKSEDEAKEKALEMLNDDNNTGAQWSNDIDTEVVDIWED